MCVKLEKQTHPGAVGTTEFQTIPVAHGWSLPSASATGAKQHKAAQGSTHRIGGKSVKLRLFPGLRPWRAAAGGGTRTRGPRPGPACPPGGSAPPAGARRTRPARPGRGGMGPARPWGSAGPWGNPWASAASPWSRGSSGSTLWRPCASPARVGWATAATGRRMRWVRWETPTARLGDTQGLKHPQTRSRLGSAESGSGAGPRGFRCPPKAG